MLRFLPAKPHGKNPTRAPFRPSFGRSRKLGLAVAVGSQLLSGLRKIKQQEKGS